MLALLLFFGIWFLVSLADDIKKESQRELESRLWRMSAIQDNGLDESTDANAQEF